MAKELKIRFVGDSSGLKKAADDSEGIISGFGKKISAFSVASGTLIADGLKAGFSAVGGLIGDSIGGASDMAETVSKVGVLFGDAAKGVEQFAANSAVQFGQTKQQALDAAATFATFGKAAGLGGDDLAKFSTDFVGLSSDLASFNNTSPEDAIEAIGAALRGEAEPMRRYGVLLDDATLRQKALELGIVSTTKDALTPQQKVLAAQQAIWEQTGAAQGDFARTSDGLANKQRILAAQFTNLKTNIGQAFLPIVLDMVTLFSNKVLPVLEKFGPLIGGKIADAIFVFKTGLDGATGTLDGFEGFMLKAGQSARAAAAWVRDSLVPALIDMGRWINENVIPAVVAIAGWVRDSFIPAVVDLVGWVRGSLIPAVQEFWGWLSEKLQPVVADMTVWFREELSPALSGLGEKIRTDLVPALQEFWAWTSTNVLPILKDLANFVMDNVVPAIVEMQQKVTMVIVKLAGWAVAVGGAVVEIQTSMARFEKGVIDKFNSVIEFMGEFAGRIKSAVGDLGSMLYGAGMDIVRGLIDGIMAMGGQLQSTVSDLMSSIPDAARSLLGIASPSKVFHEIGLQTAQGMAQGMAAGSGLVAAAAGRMSSAAFVGVPGGGAGGYSAGGQDGQRFVSASMTTVIQIDGRTVATAIAPHQRQMARALT